MTIPMPEEEFADAGRLRVLLEQAPVLLWTMLASGLISSVNAEFEARTGRNREETRGTHIVNLIHPDDVADVLRAMAQSMEQGRSRPTEARMLTASGGECLLELRMALMEHAGTPEIAGVGHDVNEPRDVQEALRQSEERFRTIFDKGPLGIALVDRHLRVTDVNEKILLMTGRSRGELVGSRFPVVNDPEEAAEDFEQMTRLFRGEGEGYRIEKRFVRASGEVGWASIVTTVIHDEEGAPLYSLRIVEDVTEQRRLREELAARAQAARDVLRGLTVREREIMELLGQGLRAAEIAMRLSVSPRTAETHLANAYRKLAVRSRAEAVAAYRRLEADLGPAGP